MRAMKSPSSKSRVTPRSAGTARTARALDRFAALGRRTPLALLSLLGRVAIAAAVIVVVGLGADLARLEVGVLGEQRAGVLRDTLTFLQARLGFRIPGFDL